MLLLYRYYRDRNFPLYFSKSFVRSPLSYKNWLGTESLYLTTPDLASEPLYLRQSASANNLCVLRNLCHQPWLEEKGIHYTVMQFSPLGYVGLNLYYNGLAKQADANWLMCWSDDAIMETTGWDKVITNNNGEFKLLKVHSHREHPYSIFQLIQSYIRINFLKCFYCQWPNFHFRKSIPSMC